MAFFDSIRNVIWMPSGVGLSSLIFYGVLFFFAAVWAVILAYFLAYALKPKLKIILSENGKVTIFTALVFKTREGIRYVKSKNLSKPKMYPDDSCVLIKNKTTSLAFAEIKNNDWIWIPIKKIEMEGVGYDALTSEWARMMEKEIEEKYSTKELLDKMITPISVLAAGVVIIAMFIIFKSQICG